VSWKPVRVNFSVSLVLHLYVCTVWYAYTNLFDALLQTGRLQQTLAGCVERNGVGLHSGRVSTVRMWPELASRGRYFEFRCRSIPAAVEFAQVSPLCTTLSKDGFRIRTVEHLLSALEALGVDNCRIEIEGFDDKENDVEVTLLKHCLVQWKEDE